MARRPFGSLGALLAVPACLLAGLLVGRSLVHAVAHGWLAASAYEFYLEAPANQIEMMLRNRVGPDTILDVHGSGLRAASDQTASVLELLAARGDAGLIDVVLTGWPQLDAEVVEAALCVAARRGHSSTVAALLQFRTVKAGGVLCRPEGAKPSAVAAQNGHGGSATQLEEHGF